LTQPPAIHPRETHSADFNIPIEYHQYLTHRADFRIANPAIMASFLENSYSLVHQDNAADVPTMSELRTQLEKGTDETKVETMKRILTIMLNGDPMPQLLMHIIRFVMPSKHKALKKLLYFYYEICPKLDASGKLKQEMILVW
jgi:coatomer subunit beta